MKRILGKSLVGVNIAVFLFWIAGFLAAYTPPSVFWVGAVVAIGLPALSVVLVGFGVLHAARRQWLLCCLNVAAVLLVVNRHWSIDRLSLPEARKGDLTLMTFNTPRYPDSEEEMRSVSALVEGVQPDLIGVQESVVWALKTDPSHIRTHAKFRTVVDSMHYATLPPRYGPEGASWVHWVQPLLSRRPIVRQEQYTFDKDLPGWPTLYVTRSELDLEGKPFAHYNIHLFTHGPSKPWNGDGDWMQWDRWIRFLSEARTSFRIREWQTEQIRELVKKERLPLVVSGDFNGTVDNWAYRRLSEDLQDAFRVAGEGWGATYHAKIPIFRIDFVLLGPEFEVVRARVPAEYVTESDHLPLVVRFRWSEPV